MKIRFGGFVGGRKFGFLKNDAAQTDPLERFKAVFAEPADVAESGLARVSALDGAENGGGLHLVVGQDLAAHFGQR